MMIAAEAVLLLLFPAMSIVAQDTAQDAAPLAPIRTLPALFEQYDPLIPQSFAFDKKDNVFAGINTVDNTIVIVRRMEGDREGLYIANTDTIANGFLVDVVKGRHDQHHIYRPKSVAIYEGHVVFLASHRDSCYFAVLDLDGNLVQRLTFAGSASAFSYSPTAHELYISGENATGFDLVVLDTRNGVAHVKKDEAAVLHYQRPRMSEVIAVEDPLGIGMAAIAMSVVFLALLLLYLVFKQVGVQLTAAQERRVAKPVKTKAEPKREAVSSSAGITEGVYAAIATAIHLYNEELHDEETAVLTINKVSRTYSPWSSKIHGLNTYFSKR